MNELAEILDHLGLPQYFENFVEEGFDTWDAVLYITESDLDALNVKLGHRRRLQAEIAHARGIPFDQLLAQSNRASTAVSGSSSEITRGDASSSESKSAQSGGSMKRKYRRHPKPDEHAPERPPSAYVLFSNHVREELKPQKLSFTDIAKTVGERWQSLPLNDKEPYETKAALAKENYNQVMADYKKTPEYRNYTKYLAEFKAKNAQTSTEVKRPKIEKEVSRRSSISGGSPIETVDSPTIAPTRPHGYPTSIPTSPSSSVTPIAQTYPPAELVTTAHRTPQLPRIVPMDPPENLTGLQASARRTVGAPIPSFLRHDTSRSSISSNISGGSTGSSSALTPITPIDEHRPRGFTRTHQSSSSSSIDRVYALPPLSQTPPQEQLQYSPQFPGTAPMKRLSLTEDEPLDQRPAQRARPDPQEGRGMSPPPPQTGQAATLQISSQGRNQGRMDPLSVLALAGNMMEKRPESNRPSDLPP